MSSTSDKFFAMAGRVADTAVKTTSNLVAKGKDTAERIVLEKRLAKCQQQMGALLYSQRKTGENNEALIQRYIAETDRINEQIARLNTPEVEAVVVHVCGGCGAEVQEDAMFCGGCGQKLP